MFDTIFLTYWAGLGIILSFLLLNIIHNLFLMAIIRREAGYKSKFSKQKFLKRFFLINNPNIPNRTFVILTYINYAIYISLIVSYICHIVIYNQTTSIVLQIFGFLSLITLTLADFAIDFGKKKL